MLTIFDIQAWKSIRKNILPPSTIGLVTTMGCLHEGHAALIKQSQDENTITVLSIFVNPTQFNNSKDYEHYPRMLEADLALAKKMEIDYVLIPDEASLYPQGNQLQLHSIHPTTKIMEGKHRPGHFDGVLTILMKLFNLVQPTQVYFGEKDYQQCVLVKSMIDDSFMPIQVNQCPTVREWSGLPFSSRNSRLSLNERELAETFSHIFHECDDTNLELTTEKLNNLGIEVEYLEVLDDRAFIAINIGTVRLIDNKAIQRS